MRFILIFLSVIFMCGCVFAPAADPTVQPPQTSSHPQYTTPAQTVPVLPTVPAVSTTPTAAEEPTHPRFDPYEIVDAMSEETLVGQLFLIRCPDGSCEEEIRLYQPGGFVLFGKDFSDYQPEEAAQRISDFQSFSTIPMLIATDEEGGTVTRVSSYPQYRASRFPSPRKLYAEGGFDLLLSTEAEKCRLLKSIGINVNLAPVCDITDNANSFMYQRSLGESPAITGAFAAEVCSLMAQEGVGSVLKHFPGYGNNTDTHTGIARDSRSLAQLESSDLIPFRSGIVAGCGGILVSHTIVEALDPDRPASLSPAVIHYLRRDLGFEGVILTDDLVMEAITDQYGTGEAAVLAILAGCDMLCSSEFTVQYPAVLEALRAGRISETQLRESAARILLWKHRLGLLAM